MATAPVAVMVEPGRIELQDREVPSPGPGQALVEVASVGVCGSDVHWYTEGRIGELTVQGPLVLGHEASGVVVSVGPGVTRLSPGQRVAMEPGVPCGRCRACRRGEYNLCPDVRFFGTPPVDGTFARYVVHDADFCHPVPGSLSDDAAALVEPLAVGVYAAWKARLAIGQRVLVTGAGPIGLLAAAVARSAGASEVVVTDAQAARLPLATRMGATEVVDAGRGADELAGRGFDVLVECSGATAALHAGLRAVREGGRAVVVGMSAHAEVPVPLSYLQMREIELVGTFRYANTYPTAITLAASGQVDLDSLVSGYYGLAQVEEALDVGHRDPQAVKVVVRPGS